jgi:hypothetical protein
MHGTAALRDPVKPAARQRSGSQRLASVESQGKQKPVTAVRFSVAALKDTEAVTHLAYRASTGARTR